MKEYFDIDKNPAGCRCCYKTPDGFDNIILTGDGSNINTLRFDRQNTYHESFGINELPVFYDAVQWLEQYFSGRKPEPFPYIKLNGCTGFRRTVMDLLAEVPYGQTVSYGELAIRASQFHWNRGFSQSGCCSYELESGSDNVPVPPCNQQQRYTLRLQRRT